jgi:glycosyltransferase involved in cell wall biosynthesis
MSETFHVLMPRDPPRLLSIVIPVYNEQDAIPFLIEKIKSLLDHTPADAEVILVNDGSSDSSISLLVEVAQQDRRFKVISLARNFGHQAAATAGLDVATGDAVVLMDSDLQDPPELVLSMIDEYKKGYDVVYAQRTGREGEGILKRLTAWLFYRLMKSVVYKELPPDVGDFRLVSRRCLNALNAMRETHRFLRGMVSWVGFPQTAVTFVRPARVAGQTKYPFRRMLLFAWTAALSFSPLPVRISFVLGAALFSVGGTYAAYALYRVIFGLYNVPGWASLIMMNCLTGGAIMMGLGVIGEYVARIFEEVKNRPLYIVSYRTNFEGEGRQLAALSRVHSETERTAV